MAPPLLQTPQQQSTPSFREASKSIVGREMRRDALIRFSAVVLAVLTAGTIVFAVINFQKERQFPKPVDGVRWLEDRGSIIASAVAPGGPGDNAGIKPGDHLLAINDQPIARAADIQHELFRAGAWSKARYKPDRHGIEVDAPSGILIDADNTLNQGKRLIALIYLGIRLYVLFRRWTAPKCTHVSVFCLFSSSLVSFHYTGKLNAFDSIIFWANIAAGLLQPALFLHFAYTFPEMRKALAKRPWLLALVYLPGAVLLTVRIFVYTQLEASARLWWNLDKLDTLYQSLFFAVAAAVLWDSYNKANTPLEQQQMKWISRGTVLAIAPFTLFYGIPFIFGALPTPAITASVLSLVLLPLTFRYAIVRYRLMDADIIFKRGASFPLAPAAIVGAYFVVVCSLADVFRTK